MALTDKVRSAVRRVRRDGPLDVVFVLFNADGMGGTARSGIEQANALLGLGEGHKVRILSVTRSGSSTHYDLAEGLEVTYLVDVRGARPAAVRGNHPAELADRESVIVPRSWDALYNGLTDVTMRDALGRIDADVLVTTTPSCSPPSPSSPRPTSRSSTRSTARRRAGSTTSARCSSSPRAPTSSCR